MENGHVKIPIELYDKFKELERNAKANEDKVQETIVDLIKFVMNIANSYTHSDDKIHQAADDAGFKIKYERHNVITNIGSKGTKLYKFKE